MLLMGKGGWEYLEPAVGRIGDEWGAIRSETFMAQAAQCTLSTTEGALVTSLLGAVLVISAPRTAHLSGDWVTLVAVCTGDRFVRLVGETQSFDGGSSSELAAHLALTGRSCGDDAVEHRKAQKNRDPYWAPALSSSGGAGAGAFGGSGAASCRPN